MRTVAEQVADLYRSVGRRWPAHQFHSTVAVDAETAHRLMRRGHFPVRMRRGRYVFNDNTGVIAKLLEDI